MIKFTPHGKVWGSHDEIQRYKDLSKEHKQRCGLLLVEIGAILRRTRGRLIRLQLCTKYFSSVLKKNCVESSAVYTKCTLGAIVQKWLGSKKTRNLIIAQFKTA